MKQLSVFFFCTMIATISIAQAPAGLIGKWRNQLGSMLTITAINPTTKAITGTYTSPSGAGGTNYPLIGYFNSVPSTAGNNAVVISFTVQWGSIGSITSWNGIFQLDKITAQWLLSKPVSSFSWDHTLVGQDTFIKVK